MKRMSIFRIAILFFAGVTVLTLLAGITAAGRERMAMEEREFYKRQEKQVVTEVRKFLAEKGYRNSGIMLTYVDQKDGTRAYKLMVHHGMIQDLGEREKQELLMELSTFDFHIENCTFSPVFLARENCYTSSK